MPMNTMSSYDITLLKNDLRELEELCNDCRLKCLQYELDGLWLDACAMARKVNALHRPIREYKKILRGIEYG